MTLHIFEAPWLRDEPGPVRPTFRVDRARRTLAGLVIPWTVTTMARDRNRWNFARDSLWWSDVGRVKLNRSHVADQLIGRATELENRADGLHARFLIARTPAGDEALAEAEDGVRDGFSAEPVMQADDYRVGPDGVRFVTKARLLAVALTGMPAYDDARVTHVAASRPPSYEASSPDGRPLADALPAGLAGDDWNPRAPVGTEDHDPAPWLNGAYSPGAPEPDRPATRRHEVNGVILAVPAGPDIAADAYSALANSVICGGRPEPPRGYSEPERQAFFAEVDRLRQPHRDAEMHNLRTATDRASAAADAMTAEASA
jgi:HK97 family phage prohead protease